MINRELANWIVAGVVIGVVIAIIIYHIKGKAKKSKYNKLQGMEDSDVMYGDIPGAIFLLIINVFVVLVGLIFGKKYKRKY